MSETRDPRDEVRKTVSELQNKSKDLVFAVASGALVLSVTFRSSIVIGPIQNKNELIFSWVCFGVCIIARVMGLMAESALWLRFLDTEKGELDRWQKALISVPTAIMYAGFTGGIVFFSSFAIANL